MYFIIKNLGLIVSQNKLASKLMQKTISLTVGTHESNVDLCRYLSSDRKYANDVCSYIIKRVIGSVPHKQINALSPLITW